METSTQESSSQEKTRARLLEAAGEVFADVGFAKATVRDICARAGANVAAVNYHFGDKERLYSEVLRFAHGQAIDKYPVDSGLADDAPADQRVERFVLSFMKRMFDSGKPAWHARLMSREMAAPTGALNELVDEQIKPQFAYIRAAVKDLLGGKASEETLRFCVQSIVGQCLFYHFGQPVMARLSPQQRYGMKDAERVASHIAAFSLAAIREIAKAEEKGSRDTRTTSGRKSAS